MAIGDGPVPGAVDDEVAALGAERDRLAEEVGRLNDRTAEEARLRAEAARAVRSALHDLRGAVGQEDGQGNRPGNAQGEG
jgi:hypothetical protein